MLSCSSRIHRRFEAEASHRVFASYLTGAFLALTLAGCTAEDSGNGSDAGSSEDTAPAVVERCGTGGGGEGSDVGDVGSPGGDVSPTDVSPMDVATAPDAGEPGFEPLPASFTYDSEYSMRFTNFQFANSSAGSSVNTIIKDFFNQAREYPIVVLMHFQNFDLSEGTVGLRGGAGVKVDKGCNPSEQSDGECTYEWDPETPERYRTINLNPETGRLDGGLESLKFVARTEIGQEVSVTSLTIRDLVFTNAALRPTGESSQVAIEDGVLRGYITYDDAEEATVKLPGGSSIPVADLLKEENLNFDSDQDGELDAWCMEGSFTARQTNIAE